MNTEELLKALVECEWTVSEEGGKIIIEPKGEEKFVPKDGDVVCFGFYDHFIGIFEKHIAGSVYTHYAVLCNGTLKINNCPWISVDMRLATEEEKQKLFDALAKDGKQWNAEKKCIEPLIFHPKDKELVWCWDDDGYASRSLGFYDEKNGCLFNRLGHRNGPRYDLYAPYIGEYPDWTKEALTILEE